MKYAYEDLGPEQFEDLVVALCQRLLGISVQGFSRGPDGGRDARFVGVAECFPSRGEPWSGSVIIQAKHTNGLNKNFSEPDFFSKRGESSVIAKEIPRIRRLRQEGHLDYYMLFSNRRLAGNAEAEIREYIARSTGVHSSAIYLGGVEQLELLLKRFPEVPGVAEIDPVDAPLLVSPEELAEVVHALARHNEVVQAALEDPPMPRTPYEAKNAMNGMSPRYASAQRRLHLKSTAQIRNFLSAPEHVELLRLYEVVVSEFQLKIISKRKDYQSFDEVMEYLVDLLFGRDAILRQHKRLTRALLFYMYWNCDIGVTGDAETDKTLAP